MKPTKMQERLNRRIADHANLKSKLVDSKTRQRYDSGGYRCPGSPKQN